MIDDQHRKVRLSLGSYLAGALDPCTRAEVEAHLRTCAACREHLADLAVLPGLLAKLDPAEVADDVAPPRDVLSALLRQAERVEERRRLELRRWRAAAIAVAGAALAAGAAVVVPLLASPAGGPTYRLDPVVASSPAAGEVTLMPKQWGTELSFSLTGLPARSGCVAVVTGTGGRTEVAGHWGPSPSHVAVQAATSMTVAGVASVTVETASGIRLLTAHLSGARR